MATINSPSIVRLPMDAKLALQQCSHGALWSVGASDIELYTDCLQFKARIHPWLKDGRRAGRARVMKVRIELTPADLYRITVGYLDRCEWKEHFQVEGIYGDDLPRLVLDLDRGRESRWL